MDFINPAVTGNVKKDIYDKNTSVFLANGEIHVILRVCVTYSDQESRFCSRVTGNKLSHSIQRQRIMLVNKRFNNNNNMSCVDWLMNQVPSR